MHASHRILQVRSIHHAPIYITNHGDNQQKTSRSAVIIQPIPLMRLLLLWSCCTKNLLRATGGIQKKIWMRTRTKNRISKPNFANTIQLLKISIGCAAKQVRRIHRSILHHDHHCDKTVTAIEQLVKWGQRNLVESSFSSS